jgi:uncharacterized protein
MSMKCPSCKKSTLEEKHVKQTQVKVDTCTECKGVWFDEAELEGIMSVAAQKLAVPSKARATSRRCPRCPQALYEFTYPQTMATVDMCKACGGLWLDGGELREIRNLRQNLKIAGKLKEGGALSGLMGAWHRLVDSALGR